LSAVRKARQGAVATPSQTRGMERELRLVVYEKELRRLLFEMHEHDYVIFEDSREQDRFVQYFVHDSAVLGEVGSRHWMPESSGLRKTSVTALGCLGFEGGGPRRNFSRDHLPHDARKLACLTELAFGAAYGDGVCDMTPLVRTRASREAEAQPPAMEFDA
jgi:hypothetical protein